MFYEKVFIRCFFFAVTAISIAAFTTSRILDDACIQCGACTDSCPVGAIWLEQFD